MRQYEIMIIVDPEVDDRQVATSLERFLAVITNDKGTIDNVDVWGRRRLAYEIKKRPEGVYVVVTFTATPATAKELDRQLGLSEQILRTKLIRPEAA
ncbi:small subunit ribosomal protein S6 [Kineosphaera limosa]|uniref:Small ribosomal subunit protein bS6 n=1 Tax=Kineosphaera limosa NBRC 100340 TaxID=1184609 RepID=K6WRC1_9MICO|nr:30S ribosomal protein S6 [Kineosphaera limosa]NYE01049.1 small subunit ribosomal protein S6 [Kineosphaera limosa]GAB94647.1 30S ribosomal protein S6 [Kineosphaera limosa NBRC 100340]